MERRLVLASLALLSVLALAGCAHPSGSMQMERVNDSELASQASQATEGADLYPAIDRQRTARRIIENDTMDLVAGRPPLEAELPFHYDGAYYELSYEVVGTQPGASTFVEVDYNATDPDGSRVAFADLPRVDRKRLGPLLANPPVIRRAGPDAELPLYYPRSTRANSTVLSHEGESLVVTRNGEEYVVDVPTVKEGPLRTFQYEATLVAESSQAYANHLKETYAFPLSGLSDAEESVVESAQGDTYYAESTNDDGFASLVERFRSREAIEGDEHSGSWLVRYEGQYYWVEMDFGAFVPDDTATTDTPDVTPN